MAAQQCFVQFMLVLMLAINSFLASGNVFYPWVRI